MATSKNNVVTFGLSGKIGDMLVFRQRDGKTIVSKVPEHSAAVSDKQLAHRKRFQQAIVYGQAAMASPETKAPYEAAHKKGKSTFNVAVADFLHAPDIEHIDLSGYAGNVGDAIYITASDDFAVASVHVSITNADQSLVEEGHAVPEAGNRWKYVAAQQNESLEGDKIVISAADMPGNIAREEQQLTDSKG
jgi:hypothetical protein